MLLVHDETDRWLNRSTGVYTGSSPLQRKSCRGTAWAASDDRYVHALMRRAQGGRGHATGANAVAATEGVRKNAKKSCFLQRLTPAKLAA